MSLFSVPSPVRFLRLGQTKARCCHPHRPYDQPTPPLPTCGESCGEKDPCRSPPAAKVGDRRLGFPQGKRTVLRPATLAGGAVSQVEGSPTPLPNAAIPVLPGTLQPTDQLRVDPAAREILTRVIG